MSQYQISASNRKVLLLMSSFIGTHTIMSHGSIRQKLIKSCGNEKNFAAIYSIVTFLTLGSATYIYFKHTKGTGDDVPILGNNREFFSKIGLLFALKGIFLIPLLKSARSIAPGMNKQQRDKFFLFQGVLRITRHPTFWMIALISISQILRGQKYSDVYFYLPMVIEALIGSLHQDQRLRNWLPPEYFDNSSWIPFGAILSGKQSLTKAMDEIGYNTLAVSVILCILTIWYCNREIDD